MGKCRSGADREAQTLQGQFLKMRAVSHRLVPDTTLLGQSVQATGLLSLGPTFSTSCPHSHFLEAGGVSSVLSWGLHPSLRRARLVGRSRAHREQDAPPAGCASGLGVRTGHSPLYFWTPQVSPGSGCSSHGFLRAHLQECLRLQGRWYSEGGDLGVAGQAAGLQGSHGRFLT